MKKIVCALSVVFALTLGAQHADAQVKKQRGKDAAIGAGSGAVTGALVSHKKGKGAVIGGAIGAGAGYLYGRHREKKYGVRH